MGRAFADVPPPLPVQLVGLILLVIGTAIFIADNTGALTAGAIIMLIAFSTWNIALLQAFGSAFATATVAVMMPSAALRRAAWDSAVSIIMGAVAL